MLLFVTVAGLSLILERGARVSRSEGPTSLQEGSGQLTRMPAYVGIFLPAALTAGYDDI